MGLIKRIGGFVKKQKGKLIAGGAGALVGGAVGYAIGRGRRGVGTHHRRGLLTRIKNLAKRILLAKMQRKYFKEQMKVL
jgi:hypothetical protein